MFDSWKPPYCTDPTCKNSAPHDTDWCSSYGTFVTKKDGRVRRFRCRVCKRVLSRSTFNIEFRTKTSQDLGFIFRAINNGEGVRSIARSKGIRPETVLNRLSRLARQAITVQALAREEFKLQEDLVADGIVSFTWSQYFPVNLHILVGSESQFVFLADYAVNRRSGSMTPDQRKRRDQLDAKCIFPKHAIRDSFGRLYEHACDLAEKSGKSWTFDTDEHKVYQRVIAKNKRTKTDSNKDGVLTHRQTSSKAPRTFDNPLMAVNYMDRELRKDSANHTRETVQWSHDANRSMERMYMYMCAHNFFKIWRIKKPKDKRCHGEIAGIPALFCAGLDRILYSSRAFFSRIKDKLTQSEIMTWNCEWPNPHNGKSPKMWQYSLD